MAKKITKKQYHHGDLRLAILEAADSILAKEGIAALSMREVSRILDVSHGAPYRHFTDKEAILAALALAGFQQLNEEQDHILARSELNGRERLKQCGSSYLKLAAQKPHRFRMMFEQFPAEVMSRHQGLADASQRFFQTLSSLVAICQKEGTARLTPAPQLAAAFWSMTHGFLSLALTSGSSLVRDSGVSLSVLEDLCLETVMRGLGPD
ncbi:MAG: TetR/AcrR family transcriptional regulator [Proteobacteria bacterium]|nr:MAG: TetR/AcrR family transcriptional regulator [Pseudomonadota bacterium]